MIPAARGCYVLANFREEVLYIGLAIDLRRRFGQHLDSPEKIAPTSLGVAVFFYWLESPDTNKLERTWMNIHQLAEGKLPVLNSVYSPTST
jgi:GIY-YIG catalytic domain